MSHSHFRVIFFSALILASLVISGKASSAPTSSAPLFDLPLAAPWPAGVTLHGGGDGSGYGDYYHKNADQYAVDFNGWPNENDPPVETNDSGLLVLAVADGCVKAVNDNAGHYYYDENQQKIWSVNYGSNVVISHAGGFQSRYAHLKRVLLPKQSYPADQCYFVAQGQPLGTIGGTGTENDAVVHLHFAMYYCDKSGTECKNVQPVLPEPMDGTSLEKTSTTAVKVTSANYSVGYEAIAGNALVNPDALVIHQPILDEYKLWGGQHSFFGRALGPVRKLAGTNIFYQEFSPMAWVCTYSTAIVQVDQLAYVLPSLIWTAYQNNPAQYGTPNTSAYLTEIKDGESGWRVDFQKASMFWNQGMSTPIIWDETNAPWKASFCPGVDNFGCYPVRRLDPYIDFSFSNASNPGPLSLSSGFSALWEASFHENDISQIDLEYEIQGSARFYIDGWIQGKLVASPEVVSKGIVQTGWHVGANTFTIRFWQEAGKPARLKLKIHEAGFSIFPKVYAAFDSQENNLESSSFQPIKPEMIDFEPPSYPSGSGEEPVLPPGPVPNPSPALPSIIETWWNGFIENVQQMAQQWWQENSQGIQQTLEQALQKFLQSIQDRLEKLVNDWLISLEQQCNGSIALVLMVGTGVILYKRHPH